MPNTIFDRPDLSAFTRPYDPGVGGDGSAQWASPCSVGLLYYWLFIIEGVVGV